MIVVAMPREVKDGQKENPLGLWVQCPSRRGNHNRDPSAEQRAAAPKNPYFQGSDRQSHRDARIGEGRDRKPAR